MPGGEDQFDRLHVLSPEFSGKRKTSRFNPRKLGDNKPPEFLRLPVVDDTDTLAADVGQVAYATGDGPDAEGLYFRSDTGWTQATGGSGAPTDAEYVVLSSDPGLSNESVHASLTGAELHDPKAHQSTHQDGGADEIQVDTLAGDNGTAGQVLGTDGSALGFQDDQDTTDHTQFTNVQPDQHHTDPTAGEGLVDEGTNQFGLDIIDSGQVTLSSGTATVDTGISTTDATFMLALGVDDPGADVAVAGELFFDTSDGTYEVRIDETDTGVGNPTVNYDIVRVR